MSGRTEGLGYGAEVLTSLLPQLKAFDGDLRGYTDDEGIAWGDDETTLQQRWNRIWTTFGPAAYSTEVTYNGNNPLNPSPKRRLNDNDINDIKAKFGFALSATKLTAAANRVLESRTCYFRLKVPKGVARGFE